MSTTTTPPPLPDTSTGWHYQLGSQALGPATAESIKLLYAEGQLKPDSFLWHPTLGEWTPLRNTRFASQPTSKAQYTTPETQAFTPSQELPPYSVFAWLIALSPLLIWFISFFVAGGDALTGGGLAVLFVNLFVSNLDIRALNLTTSTNTRRLGLAILIPPLYLFLRARRTNTGMWLLAVWAATLIIPAFLL